jgi:hypothetical protein
VGTGGTTLVADWQIYSPLENTTASGSTTEPVLIILSTCTLTFDATAKLDTEIDIIAPVPTTVYNGLFRYTEANNLYYLANGGIAVIQYDAGDNPDWSSSGSVYANALALSRLFPPTRHWPSPMDSTMTWSSARYPDHLRYRERCNACR